MNILRAGIQPSQKGSSEKFTGSVRIDPLFAAPKHWHGASPTTAVTHIAIVEALDGNTVEWMEPVSDEQYGGRVSG